MKNYDFQGIIKAISDASPSHLALISFLVLPVILNYWIESIVKFIPGITVGWKIASIVFLLAIYLACLVWLTMENKDRKNKELMRDKILARLYGNGWKSMSFESARKVLGENTTDEEIIEVIERFPTSLRTIRIKKKVNGQVATDSEGKTLFIPGVGCVKGYQENA